jgi:putative RecB family exonuclease
MATSYQITATKLQTYHCCPQSYYFRYELGLKTPAFFGSAALGTALHQSLAKIHRDWHYLEALPQMDWLLQCWQERSTNLSAAQVTEGQEILERYYQNFIASETALKRPLAVEGRIKGYLRVENLEFLLWGRYDRLDYLEDGLELIEYKSNKELKLPTLEEIDLQIGFYYLALEQRYKESLRQLSLLSLRTCEKMSFDASAEHKERVEATVSQLALRLRTDEVWEATPSEGCARCHYARYCAAVSEQPEPLPEAGKNRQIQLVLDL